jgi:hypothetical protein
MAPDSDSGKEVALIETGKIGKLDVFDASLINAAVADKISLDELI